MNITYINRAVLLCRPEEGAQKARASLMGLIRFGPFQFGLHKPIDDTPGYVFTELTSGTAVAYGHDEHECLRMLQHRLEHESVVTFLARCQLAVDHKKQDLADLRSYKREVIERPMALAQWAS